MNIQLKRFSYNARLSQETNAFAADVWVDDKKVGTAENDGHGGATLVHITDRALAAQIEAYGKTLVPAEYAQFTEGTEWLIDQLVEAELNRREEEKFAKKLAKIDAKERARVAGTDMGIARFRSGEEWRWFTFKITHEPRAVANQLAAQRRVAVDDVVVLSTQE